MEGLYLVCAIHVQSTSMDSGGPRERFYFQEIGQFAAQKDFDLVQERHSSTRTQTHLQTVDYSDRSSSSSRRMYSLVSLTGCSNSWPAALDGRRFFVYVVVLALHDTD